MGTMRAESPDVNPNTVRPLVVPPSLEARRKAGVIPSADIPSADMEVERVPNRIQLRSTSAALAAAREKEALGRASERLRTNFEKEFIDLANDRKEFHKLLSTAFGPDYNAQKAEALRFRTLKYDCSWLPHINWMSKEDMGGGLGAYDANGGAIYLSRELLSDPALASSVFAEEVGHALDNALNGKDSVGDEGELFRRLLAGESLSAAQIKNIRTENDHGLIRVDGREVEVEFFIGRGVKKFGKKMKGLGRKAKKVVRFSKKVVEKPIRAAMSAVGDSVKSVGRGGAGFAKGIGGFAGNVARLRFGRAFDHLIGGVDRLLNGTLNGTLRWMDAPFALLGDLGRPFRWAKRRFDAFSHSMFQAVVTSQLGLVRGLAKGVLRSGGGVWKMFRGRFKEGLGEIKGGIFDGVIQAPASALVMSGASAVGGVQSLVGLESAGERLSDEQIAYLRPIFGDSVDYGAVRVKTGRSGLFGVNNRPFVIGNTIYMKDVPPETFAKTLAHEMVHVWQGQNGSAGYVYNSLAAQTRDDAYDWRRSVPQTEWRDLGVEQQAQLLEDAFAGGYFDPNHIVYPDDVFAEDDSEYVAYLESALREIRAGRGAVARV